MFQYLRGNLGYGYTKEMDGFVEDEILEKSIRRSKDAYTRIKMNLTVNGKSVRIESKYKRPVERIRQVIDALNGIERAKTLLTFSEEIDSPGKRLEEYKEFQEVAQVLKVYKETEIVSGLLERLNARIKKTERYLDDITKKRLVLSLQGKSRENWAEFMVNKTEKVGLFVDLVEKYVETVVKDSLSERTVPIERLTAEIDRLARYAFEEEQVKRVVHNISQFMNKKLINEIGKKCYIFIKNINSPIKNLQEYLEFLNGFLYSSIEKFLKAQKIYGKIHRIIINTYKVLYTEAEEQFITGKVNEKRLFDRDLFYLLDGLEKAEKLNWFLDLRVKKQKKLKEFYEVTQQKSKQTSSKLEQLIFLLNSGKLIDSVKRKKVTAEETVSEIAQEMKRKLQKAVENPERENKIGVILHTIERTVVKVKHYTVPEESRAYLISEYKKTVREIGNKYGGLDEVSDSHLSSVIEGFFCGPARKLES